MNDGNKLTQPPCMTINFQNKMLKKCIKFYLVASIILC